MEESFTEGDLEQHEEGEYEEEDDDSEVHVANDVPMEINLSGMESAGANTNQAAQDDDQSEEGFLEEMLRLRSDHARQEIDAAVAEQACIDAVLQEAEDCDKKDAKNEGDIPDDVQGVPGAHPVQRVSNTRTGIDDSAKYVEQDTIPAPEGQRTNLYDETPGAFAVAGIGNSEVDDEDLQTADFQVDEEVSRRAPAEAAPAEAAPVLNNDSQKESLEPVNNCNEEDPSSTSWMHNSGFSLAVASLVENSEDDLPEGGNSMFMQSASQIDLSQERRVSLQRRQTMKKDCRLLVAAFLLGMVAVAILVALLTTNRSRTQNDSSSETLPPTEPTSFSRAHVVSLLPDFTLETMLADNSKSPTPQSLALQWILDDPNLPRYEDDQIIQRYAMATYYFSTGGASSWLNNTHWLSYGHHECEWLQKAQDPTADKLFNYSYQLDQYLEDTPCNEDKEIRHLWHFGNGLRGQLPPQVSLLTSLQSIDLAYNDLTGSIPSQLGQLSEVELLWLFANEKLTGSLPTELGLMSNLVDMACIATSVSGSLPTELGLLSSSLEVFMHDNTRIAGPIPSELGLLTNLHILYLNNNALIGTIPTQLGKLTRMLDFGLETNQLTGTLPTELSSLPDVGLFFLQENLLTGTIPTQMGLMSSAHWFSIWGNSFRGTIPSELGQLSTATRYLYLDNNHLTGSIPTELGQVLAAKAIAAYNNNLEGQLPSEFGLLKNLYGLYLYGNSLTGTIPRDWVFSDEFIDLRIFDNELTGSLPSEMGLWRKLNNLLLQNNGFTGTIPEELGQLVTNSSLSTIDLRNNSVVGVLPEDFCSLQASQPLWCTIFTLDCPSYLGFDCSSDNSTGLCGCDCDC